MTSKLHHRTYFLGRPSAPFLSLVVLPLALLLATSCGRRELDTRTPVSAPTSTPRVTAQVGALETSDALSSWNEGRAKSALEELVRNTTTAGSASYVPLEQRIAVFDNDGTLWSEQPTVELAFALDRVRTLAPRHPEWSTKEPFASVLQGNVAGIRATGQAGIAALLAATHAGMSTDEFTQLVRTWLAKARHPRFDRTYAELVYQPMLEVLAFLRTNGFKPYIVSGGGTEFIRVFAEQAYGVPPEQVIGSFAKMTFELRAGHPVLMRRPELDFLNDASGKPIGIQRSVGRRPIVTFGNSDGDKEMLQWTTVGAPP
ncbi:MAG TPA: HAD family hydrolase, partial [Polyangiaceae bacterium]